MEITEFYNKLNDQERKIFYFAIMALVLAFFDMLFLRPVLSRLNEIDEDVRKTTQAVERNIRFISYRDKIMAEDEAAREYETDESKGAEEIIAGFLKTIEVLASEAKVNLSRVTPADVMTQKGCVVYFADVDCDGKLSDMISFLYRIDMTKNLLKVVRMNMTGNKASKEDVKVEMKVAKLVIDPSTIGNYEFDSRDIHMPQAVLDEAAAELGLAPILPEQDGSAEPSPDAGAVGEGSNGAGKAGSGSDSAGGGEAGTGGSDAAEAVAGRVGGAGNIGSGAGRIGKRPAGAGGEAGAAEGRPGGVDGMDGDANGGTGEGDLGVGASGSGTGGESGEAGGPGGLSLGTTGKGAVAGSGPADNDIFLKSNISLSRKTQPAEKDNLEEAAEDPSKTPVAKTKLQKDFQNVRQGGRVRVQSLDALWTNFWAKVLGKEPSADTDAGYEGEEADQIGQDERNLWEKKFSQ